MEANGSQCIRTGARRKTCVASLAECPYNNVRFQSRSSIVSMIKQWTGSLLEWWNGGLHGFSFPAIKFKLHLCAAQLTIWRRCM